MRNIFSAALLGLLGLVNPARADIKQPFGPSATGIAITPSTVTASQCVRSDSAGSSFRGGPGCGGGAEELTVRAPAVFVASVTVQAALGPAAGINRELTVVASSASIQGVLYSSGAIVSRIAQSLDGDLTDDSGTAPQLALLGNGANITGILANNAVDATPTQWVFYKTRAGGTVYNANTVISPEDVIMRMTAMGADSVVYRQAARMDAVADGTWATGDAPGRLDFFTTTDGGTSSGRRLSIGNAGGVVFITSSTSLGDSRVNGDTLLVGAMTVQGNSIIGNAGTDQVAVLGAETHEATATFRAYLGPVAGFNREVTGISGSSWSAGGNVAFYRDGVAHAMTAVVQAQNYGTIQPVDASNGGVAFIGTSEVGNDYATLLRGIAGNATVSVAPVALRPAKTNGGTGVTSLGATEPAVGIEDSGGNNIVLVQGTGSTHIYNQLTVTSSMTVQGAGSYGGQLGLFSRTKAQIDALTPTAAGNTIFCSNCATSGDMCVSTGTAVAQWRRVGTSAGCGSNE